MNNLRDQAEYLISLSKGQLRVIDEIFENMKRRMDELKISKKDQDYILSETNEKPKGKTNENPKEKTGKRFLKPNLGLTDDTQKFDVPFSDSDRDSGSETQEDDTEIDLGKFSMKGVAEESDSSSDELDLKKHEMSSKSKETGKTNTASSKPKGAPKAGKAKAASSKPKGKTNTASSKPKGAPKASKAKAASSKPKGAPKTLKVKSNAWGNSWDEETKVVFVSIPIGLKGAKKVVAIGEQFEEVAEDKKSKLKSVLPLFEDTVEICGEKEWRTYFDVDDKIQELANDGNQICKDIVKLYENEYYNEPENLEHNAKGNMVDADTGYVFYEIKYKGQEQLFVLGEQTDNKGVGLKTVEALNESTMEDIKEHNFRPLTEEAVEYAEEEYREQLMEFVYEE